MADSRRTAGSRIRSMCRATASRSSSTSPSWSQVARAMPRSIAARIAAPSSADRKSPVGAMNLSAFHSIGLWLAVIARPPAAWSDSTASWIVGVGASPTSTDVAPHGLQRGYDRSMKHRARHAAVASDDDARPRHRLGLHRPVPTTRIQPQMCPRPQASAPLRPAPAPRTR